MVCYEGFIGFQTFVPVGAVKGGAAVHQKKGGVEISLYPLSVNGLAPAGKLLFDVIVGYMVVLAGTEGLCVNQMKFRADVFQLPVKNS